MVLQHTTRPVSHPPLLALGRAVDDAALAGNAAQDDDANRAAHRLQLLAGSGMTEACGLVSKARTRARDLLQGTASLKAGDKKSLQSFMAKLPIESMLTVVDRKDRHQDATQSSTGRRSIHPNR